MARPLSLMHLANSHSTNVGNGALILGSEAVIAEDMPRPIAWTREPWDDYTFDIRTFDGAFVERVNRETDGLIVGGAVAIHGRDYLRNAGMRFDLPLELWPKIDKPVVFYGLSHRHWRGQPFHHLDKLRRALAYAIEHPRMLFSVRNDGTKEWLESLLCSRLDGIHTIPDPAIYVPTEPADPIEGPRLGEKRLNIILAFNNEDAVYRYGGPVREMVSTVLGPVMHEKRVMRIGAALSRMTARRTRIVEQVVKAIERLWREMPINIILVPHYFDDYRMMSDFVTLCPPRIAHQNMLSTGLTTLAGARRFYGLYAQADLAISMRVHSMSPSFGLGVPMVPLVTQERMWAFLKEAQVDDLGVDAFDADLANQLYAKASYVLNNRDAVRRRFLVAKSKFREQSRSFHSKMAALFQDG